MSDVLERRVTINNQYGLHARPAALFVELCNQFGSEVKVERDGTLVNGKNILDIMTLGAGPGSELVLRIKGHDAQETMDALVQLIDSNFGEG